MTIRFSDPLILTAFVALTACGGGGDDGGGGTPGTNGLNFGAAGQQLSDAEGSAVTMQAAGFQVGGAPSISSSTITVDAGFFSGTLNGTIEIFGQTVTINNGVGALTSGEEVRLTFEPNRSGTYAAAIDATVSNATGGSINGESAYVMGFETNPTAVDSRTGTLTYTGDFQATTSADQANTQTEYEGAITVVVDFNANDADFTLDGVLAGSEDVDLEATGLDIADNGIAGGLNCTLGCSGGAGTSAVDATFYGPDVDELGGVLTIDIEVDGNDFDGVGTFIITP